MIWTFINWLVREYAHSLNILKGFFATIFRNTSSAGEFKKEGSACQKSAKLAGGDGEFTTGGERTSMRIAGQDSVQQAVESPCKLKDRFQNRAC